MDELPVTRSRAGTRWKALAAATLLLLAGGVSGVLVDRLWLLPRTAEPMPLTARAMAARLGLSPAEEARMSALLDSMHVEVATAAHHGPDSLAATARRVHARVESTLPSHARPAFRAWMHEHHQQLMRRIGSGRDDHDARHP
jgi:hypothetical protein